MYAYIYINCSSTLNAGKKRAAKEHLIRSVGLQNNTYPQAMNMRPDISIDVIRPKVYKAF